MTKPGQPSCSLANHHISRWGKITSAAFFIVVVSIVMIVYSSVIAVDVPFQSSSVAIQMNSSETDATDVHKLSLDLRKKLPNAIFTTRSKPADDKFNESLIMANACLTAINRRKILINYASNCCRKSQPKNCQTGLEAGGFDVCISFGDQSLDADFRRQNARTLQVRTGGGLWLWKPYIIWRTLATMRDDDVLFYADSGSFFVDDMVSSHICLQEKLKLDVVVYVGGKQEHLLTKADAYILMGADRQEVKFANDNQILASFLLLRKTVQSVRFVAEWLTYAEDYRIISNEPSMFAKEVPDFMAHRNDQSILSLLAKRWLIGGSTAIGVWPDPSQWGELGANAIRRKEERFHLISKTVIKHSRDKS